MLLALVACSSTSPKPESLPPGAPAPAAPASAGASWPTADQVPTLTRAFYESLGVIHATSDEPDEPDTPLVASLQPCQIEPARALEHPALARFFPGLRFFVSSCENGRYAVVSIDERKSVRLVSLEPHERLPATAWDEITGGPVVIASLDDVKLFASAFGILQYLQTVPVADLTVREELGTGSFAGTHYYEVRAPSFTVTLGSQDKRNYSVASNQRL